LRTVPFARWWWFWEINMQEVTVGWTYSVSGRSKKYIEFWCGNHLYMAEQNRLRGYYGYCLDFCHNINETFERIRR